MKGAGLGIENISTTVVRDLGADATLRDTLSEYKTRISRIVGHRIYFGGLVYRTRRQ